MLVFRPSTTSASISTTKHPLHLDIHGGAFIGGSPEYDVPFCTRLAKRTGAIVISILYRHSPRHTFPAAHEDVEDVVDYIVKTAEQRWGADPHHLTLSGFSAGANLALALAQHLGRGVVNGILTFYAPVSTPASHCQRISEQSLDIPGKIDFRLPPWDEPKPASFPLRDPLFFLMPLMDSYASPARVENSMNPIMNPILARRSSLPKHMLLIIPTKDILLHEQTEFLVRLNREGDEVGDEHVKALFVENQLHGWDQRK